MLAKLTALLSGKVAVAIVGTVLVVGGGTTAAVVATGHVPAQASFLSNAGHTSHTDDDQKDTGKDASNGTTRSVAIQGTLTQYATGSTSTSGVTALIKVTGKAEPQDGDTGETGDNSSNASNSSGDEQNHPSTATTTTKTAPTTCTLTSPFTIGIDANTKINGQAKSASDLAHDINHTVQVQAAEDSSCRLLATKVTVAAATDDTKHVFVGTVGTVNKSTSSFTLQPIHGLGGDNGSNSSSNTASSMLTVTVSSSTVFHGDATGLNTLQSGMTVGVVGTLSGTTVAASAVMAEAAEQGDNGHGKNNAAGVAGVITTVNSKSNSFTVSGDGHRSATVTVNGATKYSGVTGFGDLKQGMSVIVEGTSQSDGSVLATSVAADTDQGD